MSFIHDAYAKQLERLDALARGLSAELSSSREESRVVAESLANDSERAAEYSRNARISADEALERAAARRLSTEQRTRKPSR